MSKKRKNHSPEFKAKIALAAIKGDQSLTEIANVITSPITRSVPGKSNCLNDPAKSLPRVRGWHPIESQRLKPCKQRWVRSPWIMIFLPKIGAY